MRNCLDCEETASQNLWDLLRSGWEEVPDRSLEEMRTEDQSGNHVLVDVGKAVGDCVLL